MILYFIIGVVSGLGSGLFGIGGGAIRIPLLAYAGMPLIQAYGVNLVVIPFSAMTGAWSQRRNIKRRLASWLVVGGVLGSLAGAAAAGFFQARALAIIFILVSILSVCGIYAERLFPGVARKLRASGPKVVGGAFVLNMATGMRGGSGGSLFPAFLRMLKLDMHEAVATSLFAEIFTASAGAAVYWARGQIDWRHALIITTGAIMGARLGSRASLRARSAWLEAGLSVIIIALAFLTLWKAR